MKNVIFLSRPRRFGKSLLISTFKQIFLVNKKLFKNCWIYKNANYDWKSYLIIHIDFAKVTNDSKDGFKKGLHDQFLFIARSYNIELAEFNEIRELTNDLMIKLYEKYNEKVVILIDEYDKPILDNIDNLEVANE